MAWLPNMTQPPKVYFRVVVQPAQSVSVYVSSCCVLLAELARQTCASIQKPAQSLERLPFLNRRHRRPLANHFAG